MKQQEPDAEFTLILLTQDCRANDGVLLMKGCQMLAVLNTDGTLNLYAVVENVTSSALSLTGNCFLKVMPPGYDEIRKVKKSELELIA